MMRNSFASDNNSGVHPDILKAIVDANKGGYISYGDDPITAEAKKLFKENFGEDTESFFVLTGTGANIVALQSLTDRYNAVICTETAHINVDECGAAEHTLGVKLMTVQTTSSGKIYPQQLDHYLNYTGDQHHVQPSVVSITQPTEMGAIYSIQELKNLVSYAHKRGLKVHMDGARLGNAA
ncbi:MAG: aminotransferase class I/II-fold pyridoxal phosphate-dependent enzyme, partial [Candidatus Cloacimonetes bacterium]|nr:aminotransferase class I/II-fold pyridoxal phosphate-dependent enzyme [Candidatus Cloacimonadota bacterium]